MIKKELSSDSQMRNKKGSKKITVLAVSAVLGIMICTPVSAYSGIDSDPCPRCGDGSVWVSEEEWGRYTTDVEQKCTHHEHGTDLEMEIHTVIHYDCIDCGYGWTEDSYAHYWECHGYDGPYNN